MSNPYIAVSELTNVIYIVDGKKKYDVTKEVMGAVILTHRAIPIEKLEQIRARIEYEKIGYPPSADYYEAIMKVLEIIDKEIKEAADGQDR